MVYTTTIPIVLNLMRILFRPNHQGHVCMLLRFQIYYESEVIFILTFQPVLPVLFQC